MKLYFEKIYLHTPIRFLKSNKKKLLENCVQISILLKKKKVQKHANKRKETKQMNTPKKKKKI